MYVGIVPFEGFLSDLKIGYIKEKLSHHDTMVFHAIVLIVMVEFEKEKIYLHSCFTYVSVTMGIICKMETAMVYIIYLYY